MKKFVELTKKRAEELADLTELAYELYGGN